LKGSSATSTPATAARSGSVRPSASATGSASRSSPAADGGYPLTGVSNLPDPDYHAFRQDLADVALAGRVIASHYAEPLLRHLVADAPFYRSPVDGGELIVKLNAGDELWMLDDTRGWAWGYAGKDRRVGYVRTEAVGL
jgi:hypothetical protein